MEMKLRIKDGWKKQKTKSQKCSVNIKTGQATDSDKTNKKDTRKNTKIATCNIRGAYREENLKYLIKEARKINLNQWH